MTLNANLQNKVVLITGASGGIGAGLVQAFAAEGCRLVLHYHRNKPDLSALAEAWPNLAALPLRADLRRETEVRQLFRRAVRQFGRIDVLVANAGTWIDRDVPLARMTLAQWRATLAMDLTSVFLCCREFFRLLERKKQGNVVLISSTAGVFGEAGHVDYAAAKSALAFGLTRTLKNEIVRVAPHTKDYCGGRVNCVCPGWTLTPRVASALQDARTVKRVASTMALPQIALVEDIAHAVVFLASDRLARHISGQTLAVAGGMEGRTLWQPEEVDVEAWQPSGKLPRT